jgi:hypothetical protein
MSREAAVSRRLVLERAREIAARWTAANPEPWLAHFDYAYALLGLGDLPGAERELGAASQAAGIVGNSRRTFYRDRVELALRRERPHDAVLLTDSMFLDPTSASQPFMATTFGRFSRDRNVSDTGAFAAPRVAFVQLFAGIVPPDVDGVIERYAAARAESVNPEARATALQATRVLGTLLGFHARRTGPALDTAAMGSLLRYQAFAARADTARARLELTAYDRELAEGADDQFDGGLLFSAESHLELGDSAAALSQLQEFARRYAQVWINVGTFLVGGYGTGMTGPTRLYGRTWLLYADLAAARGLREEARRGYRMVVGMWEGGEPPVQPMVARARAALAQLGN